MVKNITSVALIVPINMRQDLRKEYHRVAREG